MKDSKIVVVCDKCLQSSCWQGIFMCDESSCAGTTTRTVKQLKRLGLEHPDYWDDVDDKQMSSEIKNKQANQRSPFGFF